MLLIWGFKARTSTHASGMFFCQRCGGDRTYEHKAAKRWFTVFFIPVVPLNDLGDYIECTSCKATYYPDALKNRTAAEMEDVTTTAVRHVATAMLLADGEIHESERIAAVDIVTRFASRPYSANDLDTDLETLHRADLTDNLEELGAILNSHGKESVLTAAVYLAGVDGLVDGRELETVREIGEALTMSRAHIEGTISTELDRIGLSS